ncbi:MAG: DUF72 domain-containing protein [Planctomycetota bacterium]
MRKPIDSSPRWPVAVGAPVWACDAWGDLVYPARTPRRDFLRWYSRAFPTAEGNSTFYGVPAVESFERWADQSMPGFEFCLKVPRSVSHNAAPSDAGRQDDYGRFLAGLAVLAKADRLGPAFLQLPPSFAPDRFDELQSFLDQWPTDFPLAVEVRHHDWFDRGANENRLDDGLRNRNIDKVLFDSRPLYQAPPDDPIEAVSQTRKPKTPYRETVTAGRPMVRMVGRNQIEKVDPFLRQWADVLAKWIDAGLQPIFFTHAPDDRFAPELAWRLVQHIAKVSDSGDWDVPRLSPPAKQPGLFD